MRKVLEGTHAGAQGAILARVQVISAYPITPQTSTVERLSEACATGELAARFITVESEHSAMATCIGAAMAGARVFTATSSQGLALMHELLFWSAGSRLPIVMMNGNRALAAPWNLHAEQTDSLAQRDTGWMQYYCSSNQEVLDTVLQSYWVAERVMLPCMVNLDGFVLTHTCEPVEVPDQEAVDAYLPSYKAPYKLDVDDPHTFNGIAGPPIYMEMRYQMQQAMERASCAMLEADEEFGRHFGRRYGLIEDLQCRDAETIIVTTGTAASTAREVVKSLRAAGRHVGLLRLRVFRPFPLEAVRRRLAHARRVVVLDRDISFGRSGVIAEEVRSALCPLPERPPVFGFIAGLGGRDITPDQIVTMCDQAEAAAQPSSEAMWIGVRL